MVSVIRWIVALPLALFFWGFIGSAGAQLDGGGLGRYLFISAMAFGVGATVMRGVTPDGHRRAATAVWSGLMACAYLGMAVILPEMARDMGTRLPIKPWWMMVMVGFIGCYLAVEWRNTSPKPSAPESSV